MTILAVLALVMPAVAQTATSDACTGCHVEQAAPTAHAGHPPLGALAGEAGDCVACHGNDESHVSGQRPETFLTFSTESPARQDEACLGCHSDDHPPGQNQHAQAGVTCAACHPVHATPDVPAAAAFPGIGEISTTCAGCHLDVLEEFAFNNRHRLAEHSLTCASCHDPHSDAGNAWLSVSSGETCTECHADKEGPFVFEHDAQLVDGCQACHVPHGSASRHLLDHQEPGALCYGCHAEVPSFHLGFAPFGEPRFGVETGCTNCHVTIHGSNIDPMFLK